MTINETKLYNRVFLLSIFTVIYNLVEGVIAMYFGIQDETLTLFGFGVDSFIEVASGVGVAVMILRIKQYPESEKSRFEKTALQITGTAFYLLSVGLGIGIIISFATGQKPETTLIGVIISVISILIMLWLAHEKGTIGKKLKSDPIIADANCTKVCIYMSVILLFSSLLYELTGFAYADIIGSIGLIYFSIKEGNEAFEKAKGKKFCGNHCSVSIQ